MGAKAFSTGPVREVTQPPPVGQSSRSVEGIERWVGDTQESGAHIVLHSLGQTGRQSVRRTERAMLALGGMLRGASSQVLPCCGDQADAHPRLRAGLPAEQHWLS